MKTEVNWKEVIKEMKSQEWKPDDDSDGEERRVFLGTVFSLYPSGKFYMPWACSNLIPCEQCNGNGKRLLVKRRIAKKWEAARERCWKMTEKLGLVGNAPALEHHGWYRYYRKTLDKAYAECTNCGGIGSREAFLDQQFQELLEEEAEKYGYFITSGEGDPCDIFIAQYRSADKE